ncbi:lef-3 [Cryptophlebia peltastica nucleopolyhedrovirus]|uniref:Lef-3 n=1 Tax=Cryptophlebia peltastica nucleopolyhedrovirus TaxID=2304025 RepID=A0A346RNS5_9ABAC|nr:lef-3 [Cryptophlebia peltastica nucleopolyhedrovirus]AXS67722.1 lef-3 [Cryptophlebia peltastica nucleopolyhedrovirus]
MSDHKRISAGLEDVLNDVDMEYQGTEHRNKKRSSSSGRSSKRSIKEDNYEHESKRSRKRRSEEETKDMEPEQTTCPNKLTYWEKKRLSNKTSLALATPRMSSESVTDQPSTSSGVPQTKLRTVSVNGELISKLPISINNKSYYILKFLCDQETKEFYGSSVHFTEIVKNNMYKLEVSQTPRFSYIENYQILNSVKPTMKVKKALDNSDFDDQDVVSVIARIEGIFQNFTNESYKLVLSVNYGSRAVQIECSSNGQSLIEALKCDDVLTIKDVLHFFNNNIGREIQLIRVKCQQINNDLKNLVLTNISSIELTNERPVIMDASEDIKVNLSRKQKLIHRGTLLSLNIEVRPFKKSQRIIFDFELKEDPGHTQNASFFCNDSMNEDEISILMMNLNHLKTMVNDMEVHIYELGDGKMSTILGITCKVLNCDDYYCIDCKAPEM